MYINRKASISKSSHGERREARDEKEGVIMSDNFCWSCMKPKKNVNGTTGDYHSGICPDCIDYQETKLKNLSAELIQKDREPRFSGWHGKDVVIRDVSVKANGQTYFIQGFHTCEPAHNTCKVFNQVKQFLDTDLKYHIRYGNLENLKKQDFWFDLKKYGQFYELGGNCIRYSNAFSLRTLDINQIWEYVEVWTKIPDKIKMRIKAKLDKGLVFASAPESHSDEKRFCYKDYSKYNETKEPKITMISELNQQEKAHGQKEATPMKAIEKLISLGIERCPECNCAVGDDWDYKDFSNKTIVVCPQCGAELHLDAVKYAKEVPPSVTKKWAGWEKAERKANKKKKASQ